jgi:glycosyltransferase involved in cell wall biosynthesis
MKNILLFIPAYNCEKQIVRVLEKITPEVLEHVAEILVVDNGSKDATREVAKEKLKHFTDTKATLVQNNANYSLGGSIKVAMNYALHNHYAHLMVLHGDDQADVRDMLPFLHNDTARAADLFVGARFHKRSTIIGYSRFRIFGNKAFNLFLAIIMRRRVDDLIAGLNLYRMKALEDKAYLAFPNNLTFDAHLLLYAFHHGLNVKYFPISWREEDQVSNAKIFKQGWILLKLFSAYFFLRGAVFSKLKTQGNHAGAYSFTVLYSH